MTTMTHSARRTPTAERATTEIRSMAQFATWKNGRVHIVAHGTIAAHCPQHLNSDAERIAATAEDATRMNVYDHRGTLLCTAHPAPIWERNIKCTMPNGFVFYVLDSLQCIGGEEFWLSTIFPSWIGEPGATYEVIDQEPAWEKAALDRITGFKPGSMLVVEHCKHNGTSVLMASERQFSIDQIIAHLNFLINPYWIVEPWAFLKGWKDINHRWGYFNGKKGMRVRFATGKTSSISIYMTA